MAISWLDPAQTNLTGQTLIDVREYPEYAAGYIKGSRLMKASAIAETLDAAEPVVLICRSGRRALDAANTLEARGFTNLRILNGGIQAWQSAGLPLIKAAKIPVSLERQVRIIAGSLVLFFMLLGATISPWLFLGATFVAAGLVFAGITDICMMATLLGKAPWNRAATCN